MAIISYCKITTGIRGLFALELFILEGTMLDNRSIGKVFLSNVKKHEEKNITERYNTVISRRIFVFVFSTMDFVML